MFDGKARKVAETLAERMSTGASGGPAITTELKIHSRQPEKTAPGAGPVRFVWYEVLVSDGTRTVGLDVEDVTDLLEEIDGSWDAARLFRVVDERGLALEPEDEPAT
jgi:hypothetical protein